MPILTPQQAANALRVGLTDPRLVDLLPLVDKFIERATGRDWTQDTTKNPLAVSAATMLLVQWYDNPAMLGNESVLSFGLTNVLSLLEVEALKYRKHIFHGIIGAGLIYLTGARKGDDVISLVGVYGVSGDQSSSFEAEVSEDNALRQLSTNDLSDNIYVVILKSPADDVLP